MTKLFEMSSGAKQFKNQLLRYVEVLVEVDIEKWCFILFSLEDPNEENRLYCCCSIARYLL